MRVAARHIFGKGHQRARRKGGGLAVFPEFGNDLALVRQIDTHIDQLLCLVDELLVDDRPDQRLADGHHCTGFIVCIANPHCCTQRDGLGGHVQRRSFHACGEEGARANRAHSVEIRCAVGQFWQGEALDQRPLRGQELLNGGPGGRVDRRAFRSPGGDVVDMVGVGVSGRKHALVPAQLVRAVIQAQGDQVLGSIDADLRIQAAVIGQAEAKTFRHHRGKEGRLLGEQFLQHIVGGVAHRLFFAIGVRDADVVAFKVDGDAGRLFVIRRPGIVHRGMHHREGPRGNGGTGAVNGDRLLGDLVPDHADRRIGGDHLDAGDMVYHNRHAVIGQKLLQIADAVFNTGQDKGLDLADVNLVAGQAVQQDHVLAVQNDVILCKGPIQNQRVLAGAPGDPIHIARDADDVIACPQIDPAHVSACGDRDHISAAERLDRAHFGGDGDGVGPGCALDLRLRSAVGCVLALSGFRRGHGYSRGGRRLALRWRGRVEHRCQAGFCQL